jgi:hypothetical protein
MSPESRNLPEQEFSIKARAHEVYAEQPRTEVRKPVRPFPVVLRETPAEPLSATTKAVLWIAGVIVAVLFLAALWRVVTRHGLKRQDQPTPHAATGLAITPSTHGLAMPSTRMAKTA